MRISSVEVRCVLSFAPVKVDVSLGFAVRFQHKLFCGPHIAALGNYVYSNIIRVSSEMIESDEIILCHFSYLVVFIVL